MATDTTSASGIANSVLRVRAFIQVHLQPVEDRAPPDAAIARPEHPVSLVGEVEELGVETHPLGGRERLIAFRQVHTIIELAVNNQQRCLPITYAVER